MGTRLRTHTPAPTGSVLPSQRLALPGDEDVIAALMRESVLAHFPTFYTNRQTRSAAVHIAHVDRQLIEDGTYFVHVWQGQIVACGGWSKRDRLYTGSGEGQSDARLLDPAREPARVRAMFVRADWARRGLGRAILRSCQDAARSAGFRSLSLMATLPGVPLYRSFGFTEIEKTAVTMPDGVRIDAVSMTRLVDPN
jgi:GNAT superfamily N-acetyltransferase